MKRYTYLPLALVLLLSGAGCAALSGETGPILPATNFVLTITKSENNSRTVSVPADGQKSLAQTLAAASVSYRTVPGPEGERMAELDGVLATASKAWNLYIDAKKVDWTNLESVTIKPAQRIEWRYETE